jgi:hypothetical protein
MHWHVPWNVLRLPTPGDAPEPSTRAYQDVGALVDALRAGEEVKMQRLLGELRREWGLPPWSPEAGAACAPGRVGVSGLGLGPGLYM